MQGWYYLFRILVIIRRMVRGVDLRVFPKGTTMPVNVTNGLPIQVKQAEKHQCAASDSRKPVSDLFVQCEPE